MKLDVKEKRENPLLHRTEIKAGLAYTGKTPSREDVKKLVADKLGSEPELTIIKKIETVFGFERGTVYAYVYKDKEQQKRIEPVKKAKKKKEKPAKEEAKKPEKKEEKPKKVKEPKQKKETAKEEEKQEKPESKKESKKPEKKEKK